MIKNILFDLDDTLLDFHKAEKSALTKTFTVLGINHSDATIARYSEINAAQWQLLEKGELTREQVLTQRFDLLFEEIGVTHCSSDLTKNTYEKYLSQGHFFIPGAKELLQTLMPMYNLYLVSNGASVVQAGRIQSAGIASCFKQIFISEELGVNKPQLAFFTHCFVQIPDFSAEETIIVGDSLTSDIQGGINAGIHTCWFNPHHKPAQADIPAEYEISALADLPALLEQIK